MRVIKGDKKVARLDLVTVGNADRPYLATDGGLNLDLCFRLHASIDGQNAHCGPRDSRLDGDGDRRCLPWLGKCQPPNRDQHSQYWDNRP